MNSNTSIAMIEHVTVRCTMKRYIQLTALVMGPLLVGGLGLVGGLILFHADFPGALMGLVLLAIPGMLAFFMSYTCAWIELDGGLMRTKNFWTRQVRERRIGDIRDIRPLVALAQGDTVTDILDALFGKVRGYQIRFHSGGRSVCLMRHDMTNVDVMIAALAQQGKLVTWPMKTSLR